MNMQRVLTLVGKEAREVLRDRVYLMLAFALPVVFMVVFAYGMTWDIESVGLQVVDESQTPLSREYAQHFLSTHHFRRVGGSGGGAPGDAALVDGSARVVLWIGPDFESDLAAGHSVDVLAEIDGAFTMAARTLRGYLEGINAQANAELRAQAMARRAGVRGAGVEQAIEPVRLQTRFLYNPDVSSVVMVAPSMMMLILILVPPLLIAVSVVREKETGAIYNISSSTVTRLEFLLGKLVPAVVISMLDGILLWLIVWLWFDVPFRGSVPQFALAMLLYVTGTAGLGLLVSTAVRTQQAAIIITTLASTIIATQFSGLFAPLETAKTANQALARLFPVADFLAVVRGMYLRGAGVEVFWPELLRLAAYAVVVLWLAHALFHKRSRA
ncbi:MAG: ABC transporter permease [Nevskia sp.]|nr:ABC transporter permease [Nevskia sp.]